METKKQKFFEECIEPALIKYDIDPNTVTYYPENTRKLEDIRYSCKCGKKMAKRYKAVKNNPLCDICSKKSIKKRGPKSTTTMEQFEEIALSYGYKVTPREGEKLINAKSKITVTNIETGESHPSSYARFRAGHPHSHHHASLMKVLSINEVKNRVKKAGFIWIEGTVYVDAKTPIKVLCHCGDEYMVAVANLHEDRVGCEKCYRYKRDNPWAKIQGIADENGCKLLSQDKEYKGRDSTLYFLCSCGNGCCCKMARNFMKAPWCNNCADERRKKTNLKKYGAENVLASGYGIEKTKTHYRVNHNAEHNMQVKEIREKGQATCMKNNGVPWVIGTKENERRRFEALVEKYGSRTTLHSPQFKKTMMEKYDCEHSMQNSESYMKMLRTSLKLKEYKFPSGRTEYVQGYEPICLDYLLMKEGIDEDDIVVTPSKVPEINYEFEGQKCKYYVDIYIKSQDRAIEVKSDFTYKRNRAVNNAKWDAASKLHAHFDVYIFDLKYKTLTTLHLRDSNPEYIDNIYLQMEMYRDKTAEVHGTVFSNAVFLSYLKAIMYFAFINRGFVVCEISDKNRANHYNCALTFQKGMVGGDEKELTMLSNYTHNLFDSTDFEKSFDHQYPLIDCKRIHDHNMNKNKVSLNKFIESGIVLTIIDGVCKISTI